MSDQQIYWADKRPILLGTTILYDFRDTYHILNVPNQIRPAVIIACDEKLIGIPVVKPPLRHEDDVVLTGGGRIVLVSLVTDIKPYNIHGYVGEIGEDDLAVINEKVKKYRSAPEKQAVQECQKPISMSEYMEKFFGPYVLPQQIKGVTP